MSQLTIYLDEETMANVRSAAKREHVSVSQWARLRLGNEAGKAWPEGFFSLFGSLARTDLSRPSEGDLADDAPRGKF